MGGINTTFVLIVLYVIAQIGIGFWASRFVKNSNDYMLAGQTVGLGLAMFSLFATWFGAETLLGTSAAVAEKGIAVTRSDPFGYALCLILMGIAVVYELRRRGYTTAGDFFRERFSEKVELVVTLVMVPTSLLWASSQLLAFGQVLSTVTDNTVQQGLPVATCLIIVYTFFGGLLGDIATDMLRGMVLIVGLVLLTFFVVDYAGGIGSAVGSITPEQMRLTLPDESFLSVIDGWMVPILGSLIAQEALSRLLATKSAATARRACFIGSGMYLFFGLMPVFVALVGSHFDFPRHEAEEFMPDLAKHILPPALFILFVGALLSAILSTVDSTLLTFSTLVANNIVFPHWPRATEKQKLLLNRLLVVTAGGISYWIAAHGDSVYALADLSSSFGSTGLLVTFFMGMWWKKRGGPRAAMAALTAGIIMSLATAAGLVAVEAPFLLSALVSLAAYLGGVVFDKPEGVDKTPSISYS